jgi:chaperonin GroEL
MAQKKLEGDELNGFNTVIRAIEQPLIQIAINAGKEKDSERILREVQNGKVNAGYNAVTDQVIDDMLAAGIVDPVKMSRTAIENAVSAAAMLLTTEAAIAEIPEPKAPMGDGGMGGMGGMDF